ncbi:TadG family pilus assembly protein [Variovorax sp. V118]|uniref:TadG family pilus assembly protein n=1 Tax=Variovorax sp. V118 TaxID=3065954 RepID=UPI0034E88E29
MKFNCAAFPNSIRNLASPGTRRQSGSILVNATIALSLIVILLIGSELGYLFYMKREFQKAVDLAALAGAQYLPVETPSDCGAETAAAEKNAKTNLPSVKLLTVECGLWSASSPTTISATSGIPNAVRVTINEAPSFSILSQFSPNRIIGVEAIAVRDEPMAVFSVGSNLINTNPEGALIGILRLIGVDPNIDLVTYRGLAGVKITPAGLLHALKINVPVDIGVGELNTLLAARQISVSDIVNIIITLAGQQGVINADVLLGPIEALGIDIDELSVQLGTASDTPGTPRGLFANIKAPTALSALAVDIDALSLLTTAIGVGTKKHALTLDLGLGGVTALTGISAEAKLRVIEPPSIGIGGVKRAGGIGATAYNSQIRLYVNINTSSGGLVSGLLNLLGTKINLPIMIDVTNAYGELASIDCSASPNRAGVDVTSTILNACIGNPGIGTPNPTPAQFEAAVFSTSKSCETGLQPMNLVQVLGIPLLSGKAHVPALSQSESVTVPVGGFVDTDPNDLKIGDTVVKLISQLLGLVLAQEGDDVTAPSSLPSSVATTTANDYLSRAGVLSNGKYNIASARTLLTNDGFTWDRPCGLLSIGTCPMPTKWNEEITPIILLNPGCSGSSAVYNSCVAKKLADELQTTQGSGILGAVGDLLGALLGSTTPSQPSDPKPNLLAGILVPVMELLRPALNLVGKLISDTVLSDIAGLDIGRSRVSLQSLGCKNTKLVH